MPPDATDTKRRILVAAGEEFARYGLAGARVDRIADSACVNKRSIYVHFGPKEELFDLVVARTLSEMSADVPFTPNDLPRYAGELFDYLISTPAILRLVTWAGLERPVATDAEMRAYAPKVAALDKRYNVPGADVLALLLGLTTAWTTASPALRAHAPAGEWTGETLRNHRALLVTAVEGLLESAQPAGPGSHPGVQKTTRDGDASPMA